MANYSHLTTNSNPLAIKGGYKDKFYFCAVADFTTFGAPTSAGAALGDTLDITTAHTFTGTKGFYTYETKQQTVTVKSAAIGDPGAKLLKHTAEFTMLGDTSSTQEQLQRLLNAKVICLVKDANCLVATAYIQLGDECTQPIFTVEFDGKTTAEGMKEYKVTAEVVAAKYFYTAAVTLATA
jgi:hypothetical protein